MLLWFLADSIQIVVRGGVFEVLCTDVAASRTDVSHKSCQKDNEPHYIFVYGSDRSIKCSRRIDLDHS